MSLLLPHIEACFIQELRTRMKGDLFIDVGASAGFYAINLADRFNEVWAVEPCPVWINKLKEYIRIFGVKNIHVIEKAVSDKSGSAMLYGNIYVNQGLDSPSLKQSITLPFQGIQKPFPLQMGMVETITLTELIGDRMVDLVKVDTEGAEWEILQGSLPVIDQIKAWSIEMHNWAETPSVVKLLTEHGFKVRERGLDARNQGWLLATRP